MSEIEGFRERMQGILSPDVRAISARLDALEKQPGGTERHVRTMQEEPVQVAPGNKKLLGFEQSGNHHFDSEKKFEEMDRRAAMRHEQVMQALRQLRDRLHSPAATSPGLAQN